MSKAFLSHNSFDKDFVGEVFDKLGALRAVYDKETFRRNCDLTEQIRSGLNDCQVYVLFLSKAALESGWVSNELDIAHELKTRWSINKFLIFQLDEANWASLPAWASRYVTSCPPSPEQVALRIRDELEKDMAPPQTPYGRDEDIRALNEAVLELENPPKFIFLSGPTGIGRRTIVQALYNTFYREIGSHKITVALGAHDDITALYRNLLGFSANWRARELFLETERFTGLSEPERIVELSKLIHLITVSFQQVLVLDVGGFAFGIDQKPLGWLTALLETLDDSPYPYLVVLSSRYIDTSIDGGIFYHVRPINEENSRYLFKILANQYGVRFPNKQEKDIIEGSVIGHPGLICSVVNYLRHNPHYRPNRTHNSIIQLIRAQIESMLLDFIKGRPGIEQAVAFFGEAFILSYAEIAAVSAKWPDFDEAVSQLLDAGFLVQQNSNYQLAPYIQRYATNLVERHFSELTNARKALFEFSDIEDESAFVSTQLLDARIVEHFTSGTVLPGYMSNLVMPAQQLKAARREYDASHYKQSLQLSKEAYEQTSKLSANGLIESWRLIGLSAIRIPSDDDFEFFSREYDKIPKTERRDAIFFFAKGLKARLQGDLREALPNFERIVDAGMADAHCLREVAYIYAFDGRYELASQRIVEARRLAPSNPFIIDIEAFILLEKFRKSRDTALLSNLELCIERLESADKRERTNFSRIRKSMMDVFAYNHLDELRAIYGDRFSLPIHAKLSLLDTLSSKGKNDQYEQLRDEVDKAIMSSKNKLAEIEFARIQISHLAYACQPKEAEGILNRFRRKFTEQCVESLTRLIDSAKAQSSTE
ncbi:TIR domain-containing protein [Pseudomonas sp. SP16.1]|uniref:TIR domain-containing protein n=1 Tax=Pseudomonas sp. SP16.1 TaxID=3458854 RepID=UPI0040453533